MFGGVVARGVRLVAGLPGLPGLPEQKAATMKLFLFTVYQLAKPQP